MTFLFFLFFFFPRPTLSQSPPPPPLPPQRCRRPPFPLPSGIHERLFFWSCLDHSSTPDSAPSFPFLANYSFFMPRRRVPLLLPLAQCPLESNAFPLRRGIPFPSKGGTLSSTTHFLRSFSPLSRLHPPPLLFNFSSIISPP